MEDPSQLPSDAAESAETPWATLSYELNNAAVWAFLVQSRRMQMRSPLRILLRTAVVVLVINMAATGEGIAWIQALEEWARWLFAIMIGVLAYLLMAIVDRASLKLLFRRLANDGSPRRITCRIYSNRIVEEVSDGRQRVSEFIGLRSALRSEPWLLLFSAPFRGTILPLSAFESDAQVTELLERIDRYRQEFSRKLSEAKKRTGSTHKGQKA